MSKVRLTKTVIDAAKPNAKDYEIRDTTIPGLLLKVTPTGRKVFMLCYVAASGQRRKPAIGRFGEITVEQARTIAQDWLSKVRYGVDPSTERAEARKSPTVKELCIRFLEEHCGTRNKPSTKEKTRLNFRAHVIPILGNKKVHEVTRADISEMMARLSDRPVGANRVLSSLRKMFNLAEVWGYRPDGSNPCRHIPKYPENGKTRLIRDDELRRLFAYLDRADVEGLEHPFLLLAIRLQFEFAVRMSEILQLRWEWIDLPNRRIVWPDSKTGGMSKPISQEAARLFETAPTLERSPFVCPSIFDPSKPMAKHTYYHA